MSKHPFLQLIRKITPSIQGLLPSHSGSMTRKHNAGVMSNFRTEGNATLADFFVAPPRSAVHSFVVASRTQTQGRSFQLQKEGV